MEQKLFTKNFTLLVLGQASSLFGNYILRLALSMYVLEVTGRRLCSRGFYLLRRFRRSFCPLLEESWLTGRTRGISWWRWTR